MATGNAGRLGRRGERGRGVLSRWVRLLLKRPAVLDPFSADDRPGEAFEQVWRPAMKRRVIAVVAVVACWVVGIQGRLIQLQVFQHGFHAEKARANQQSVLDLEPPRGDILDRHGRMLAYSVDADLIFGDPTLVEDPAYTAAAVCAALGDCSAAERVRLVKGLTKDSRKREYFLIRSARAVSPEQVDRVAALGLPGIALKDATARYYPRAELASHVLGFVGEDGKGLAGIEYTQNPIVEGEPGLAVAYVDAKRQRLETRVEQEPVPGARLELTIDLGLQHIAERELKRGVIENHADAGSVVMMNPMTGELLAVANYPTFNPNLQGDAGPEAKRNRAVQDIYEPGSTFKIVTAAAALEAGIVKPTDLIDCRPGVITMPGRRVTEYSRHNYGVISFEDVIVKSSNVGAIRVGWKTGAAQMKEYVERFGFGQRNTRELPGVRAGMWDPAGLNQGGLASVSMGYQIGVTPLQMATAASVVANGGLLMKPRLVRAIVRDGKREELGPELIRRVIQPETAATLTAIMEAVTERGTATAARLDRYQVAGKTGTTEKVGPGGGYSQDHNASFVGFVPSRRPAFTILVVIDTPRAKGYAGGIVAAPIFKRIAEAALQHLGVPPTIDPLPPVILANDRVEPVRPRTAMPTIIPAAAPLDGPVLVPDVRGLSARAAIRTLAGVGVIVRPSGSGLVVDQTPAPGLPVVSGTWGAIQLDRRPPKPPAPGGGR
jgi:cell division protein FtsI (penicillin-binding protein 3)